VENPKEKMNHYKLKGETAGSNQKPSV